MKKSWLKRAASVLLTTAMVGTMLVGCGGSESASAGTSGASGTTAASTGDKAGVAKKNGETIVTIAMGSAWADLIPYNGASGGYYSGIVLGLLYDRLAYINLKGEISPRAAESWEIADDKKSIIFHLNKNGKWSDGEPVTANDFVFAAKMVTDPNCPVTQKSCYSILQGCDMSGNVDGSAELGAEAIDDYTLKYTFKDVISQDVTFPSYFQYYLALPEHLLSDCSPADYTTNPLWNAPVGNGPCIFESTIAGSEVVMSSNPDYYLGAAPFDKLVIKVMATTNMTSALISGDVDMVYPQQPVDELETMEGVPGLAIKHLDAPSQPYMMIFNQMVYKDSRLRRAVDMAIDRESIANMLRGAVAVESPIMSSTKYYDETCTYTYDPDAAKALIDEMVADGSFDPTQPLVISTPSGARERVANILQQNLQAIGINTTIQVMEAATMFAGFYDGTTGIGLVNMTAQTNPMYLRGMLTNDSATFVNVESDLWDDYYKSFMNAATEDEAIAIVKDMQQTWLEDVPIIMYSSTFEDYAYNTRLGGNIGLEDDGYMNIPVWEWEINE